MPIVDGRYELKMSTRFAELEEGIEEIKRMIKRSRKIRINNIPSVLLEELVPMLSGKDLKIILPLGEEPTDKIRQMCEVATTKARIYVEHDGREANTGSILFPKIIFGVTWLGNEILEISTMEYSSCVKCMHKTFEGAWRYSRKW